MTAPRVRRLRSGTVAVVRLRPGAPRAALSALLTAASRTCHATGRFLNRLQWRVDGVHDPAGPLLRRRRRPTAVVPAGYAQGRADLQLAPGYRRPRR